MTPAAGSSVASLMERPRAGRPPLTGGPERRGRPHPSDPLDGVRPGGRRSYWLRQALASEGPELASAAAAPPFSGAATADVAIVGGGYTGLWTALRLREVDPGARIVILERDICGGGPSGRNGGFVTGWWDELPGLIARFGETEAVRAARAMDDAIASLGPWCEAHAVDAEWLPAGFLQVSAAPAQDGAWDDGVEATARVRAGDRWFAVSPDDVAQHAKSPVFRGGAWMPHAGTVQPGRLARGLRRVALEAGIEIHEGTSAILPDGQARGSNAVQIATTSRRGSGLLTADRVVVATNAWAAGWSPVGRRLLTWSSYIVLTEPVPDLLEEIGWTAGEGIADARFTLHYARTTADGRIALGGGGGRAGWGGRIGRVFTHDAGSAARAADGLRRWFPSLADVRIEDAWGGPIDITDDHRPWFGTLPGGRIHFGLGDSGNGVAASIMGGRILAALAAGSGGPDDDLATLPIVGDGATPKAFPPEPLRGVGARVFREATVRREAAQEAGRRAPRFTTLVSRVPRRLGYHLGPE
ncbi:MAG TPA: FAD-binding oxidoreductase [Candidatus Limnocylindrales bacterium]|nr:FAD-binding oxidoreductase [Candidatus Limnocylindrales bacterium]